jgi:hypothetical protein
MSEEKKTFAEAVDEVAKMSDIELEAWQKKLLINYEEKHRVEMRKRQDDIYDTYLKQGSEVHAAAKKSVSKHDGNRSMLTIYDELKKIEEYELAKGYVTQDEIDQENAHVRVAATVQGDNDLDSKRVPANRAERRAAQRAMKRRK